MRLATFNILHGRSEHDGTVDLARFAEAIRAIDADVLALQEVDYAQQRSHLADLTAVAARAMNAQAHRFVAALTGTPGATWVAATGADQPSSASYGIALLSRFPVSAWQVLRLPRLPMPVPVYLPSVRKVVTVCEEPRTAVLGCVQAPSGSIWVASTHLSFIPGWNHVQLHRLQRNVAALADPVVVMGDLNLTRPAALLQHGFRPLAELPTFPRSAPLRQLDHALARGRLPDVLAVSAPEQPLSDHLPLVVDLA